MAFTRQLKLLLWKNFTLRKRQPVRVVVELVWPLILFLILMWVKLDNEDLKQFRPECHFDSKAMPSAGLMPFFQSLFCTANNTCHKSLRPSELPDITDGFNTSILSRVVTNVERLLSNTTVTDSLVDLVVELSTIDDLLKKLLVSTESCNIKLSQILNDSFDASQEALVMNISLSDITNLLDASLKTSELISVLTEFGSLVRDRDNVTDVAEFISNDLCMSGFVHRLIIPSGTDTGWINRLCGLGAQNKLQLLDDLYNSVDPAKVRSQITWCAASVTFRNLPLAYRVWNLQSTVNNLRPILDMINSTFREVSELYANSSFISGSRITELTKLYANNSFELSNTTNSTQLLWMARFLLCEQDPEIPTASGEEEYLDKMIKDERKSNNDSNSSDSKSEDTYDNTTSQFCNSFFHTFETTNNDRLGILWRQMKPLIRGKITFTPNTPVVRAILKQANSTFQTLSGIQTAAVEWLKVSENITAFLNDSREMNIVRGVVELMSVRDTKNSALRMLSLFLSNGNNSSDRFNWQNVVLQLNATISMIAQYFECIALDKFEPFDSENELVKASLQYVEKQSLLAALVFDGGNGTIQNGSDFPPYISYKIRMDIDRVDSTHKFKVVDRFWSPGSRFRPVPDMKYLVYGFAFLQDMIEHSIIRTKTGRDDVGIIVQQFPYPCYIFDRFTMAISRSMPMFMTLAWIFSAAMIVKGIVYEKEHRLKEVMKVMGLSNSVHWISWFITSFVMMFLSVLLLVTVLKGGRVLEHSDGFIVFVFLIVFTIATITQCFMFSVFFSRANLAAACAAILYFIGYLPYAFVVQWEEYMLDWHKAIACLSSTVAFGFGCSYFSKYEEQGVGAQWNTVMSSPIPEDNFSLFRCIVMMLVDSILYLIVTWYVEAVFPGEFGVPKRWYFLFTKSYWRGQYSSDDSPTDPCNVELLRNQSTSDNFEAEQTHLPLGVSVQDLRKIYKEGKKVAVDGLSLNFYEGQITSFLGHNGAGKTTTISILTGLFPPTQGTAYVYGKDIRHEMDQIRHNMGMCPQYNVLFENLTVEEHIYFYGLLKGMDKKDIGKEVDKMISDVELPHKRTTLAKDLSGGMQRKLSIAMAFTAGSKVVILDEPTAGVDPYARRSIWDLLLRYKAGHTIILSTHFMDEADMLGDRIAIISHGRLMCCGSSMFLKKRFGSGYYLTLVVADKQTSEVGESNGSLSYHHQANGVGAHDEMISESAGSVSSVENATTEFIRRFIPETILVESFASEITYQLPDDLLSIRKFDALFAGLDNELKQLGISGYGVSSTSLEEVFLNVAKLSGVDEDNENQRPPLELYADVQCNGYARPVSRLGAQRAKMNCLSALFSKCKKRPVVLDDDDMLDVTDPGHALADEVKQCNGAGQYRMSGAGLLRQQFLALFIKRFHYLRRSKKSFFSQIILPAIFICIAMIFSKINPPTPQMPAMEIHPWLLQPQYMEDNHLYMFYSKDLSLKNESAETDHWIAEMERLLLSMPGLGTRCMNTNVHTIDGFPCEVSAANSSWTIADSRINSTEPCSCDSGFQRCPEGAAGPEPSKLHLPSTDFLYDLTSRNITDWLVKTTWDYKKKRYGGLTFGERQVFNQLMDDFSEPISSTSKDSVKAFADKLSNALRDNYAVNLGASNITLESFFAKMRSFAEQLITRKIIKVWYDNTGYVSSVAYMNGVHNMLLRANSMENDDEWGNIGISVTNHPMNRTAKQMASYTLRASAVDALIAISVIFAMSQIPASFIVFLIEERESGSKHLQFVSGVSPVVFWIVNFIWDICNYLVSATLCIILFMVFQQHQYVSADNAPCLMALLFLYGWAVTPMMYPASYFFKVPSTAFVLIGCINIFLGLLSTLSTFILELFMEERLDKINNVLRQVFLVLPHFCLGRGLIDMTRNQLISDVFASLGRNRFESPFTWNLVGKNLFCLVFLGLFFFILTLCIEYQFWYYKIPFFRKRWDQVPLLSESNSDEDIDVADERRRITNQQQEANSDILVLDRLTKVYGKQFSKKSLLAVDNVTVGIHKGECFGLLGVNGAGKTTTFKMLTGDVKVTAGDARLAGYSVRSDLIEVHQRLGYCPQFDAVCSLLTATEHLSLYARLRGVPESDIPIVVQWAIQRLGLSHHAKKRAGDMSGGNRRKLSTAIALIGNPPVVFLDEPTTGMDPKARRFLWNCIADIVKDGRSVVLTSHSMEECEALCNRIAIMVNGTFKCIGSVQHLKNRFGSGYTVTIRVADQRSNIQSLKEFIELTFVGIQLREEHRNVLHYHLAASGASLAQVFHHLELARNQYSIEDYSVSQTTLDQVFLNFAKLQTDLFRDEVEIEAHANGHDTQGPDTALKQAVNGHSSDGVMFSSADC